MVLESRAQRLQEKGIFVLATNDLDENLTMEKMLSLYKSQQSVEKGFRFLKSPDFLTSSLYLKKPERIKSAVRLFSRPEIQTMPKSNRTLNILFFQ